MLEIKNVELMNKKTLIKLHEHRVYPYHSDVPGYDLGLFTKIGAEDLIDIGREIYLNE